MRRKRKTDTILITTALVMVAAVSVALIFRLIQSSDDDLYVSGLPAGQLTEPAETAGTFAFEVEGLIDRHQSDSELGLLLDEIQAPVHGSFGESQTLSSETSEVRTEPTAPAVTTAPSTTTTAGSPTSAGTVFEAVDIRYYVLSETGLNLREAPSTKAAVKQKLEYGMAIRVIGLSSEWAKVRLAGLELGYVSREYISKYPPVTSTAPTTTKRTTTTAKPAATTTRPPSTTTTTRGSGQGGSPIQFVLTGTPDAIARANFNIIKNNGLINKAGSSSINRHYEVFTENGDGTITVDGVTFGYLEKYGSRRATHYDGLEVCIQSIRANGGRCWLGHTSPVNHNTGSGIPAQRGIVAVPASEVGVYPRGTVLFVRGYGIAVVGDRSNSYFDLCYDAGESHNLTRNNTVSAIYVIARP